MFSAALFFAAKNPSQAHAVPGWKGRLRMVLFLGLSYLAILIGKPRREL